MALNVRAVEDHAGPELIVSGGQGGGYGSAHGDPRGRHQPLVDPDARLPHQPVDASLRGATCGRSTSTQLTQLPRCRKRDTASNLKPPRQRLHEGAHGIAVSDPCPGPTLITTLLSRPCIGLSPRANASRAPDHDAYVRDTLVNIVGHR